MIRSIMHAGEEWLNASDLREATPALLEALKDILPYAERACRELDAQSAGSLYPNIRAAALKRARAAIDAAEQP